MLARVLAVLLYAALGFGILSFIFMNREAVSITLFPLPYQIELPLYVALSSLFVLGLLMGLLHSFTLWISYSRRLRRAQRTIAQQEQEIAAKTNPTGVQ